MIVWEYIEGTLATGCTRVAELAEEVAEVADVVRDFRGELAGGFARSV